MGALIISSHWPYTAIWFWKINDIQHMHVDEEGEGEVLAIVKGGSRLSNELLILGSQQCDPHLLAMLEGRI